MRLICPNCGAQYEVADDVIPEEGRDVQCSNCANTWFEKPQDGSIESAFADVAPKAPPAPEPAPAPQPAPSPEPQRQALDPAIADILREEAAREAQARKVENDTAFQMQPDLGMTEPDNANVLTAPEAAVVDSTSNFEKPVPDNHKELLPDIEEINSSLRPESERIDLDGPSPEIGRRNKSGFARGFMFTILILLVLVTVYIFAPQISETVPQVAEPVNQYVELINEWRLSLDAWAQDVRSSVQ